MLYLIITLIAMLLISSVNCIFLTGVYDFTVFEVVLTVLLSVLTVVLLDAIIAFAVRWLLPKKWFAVQNEFFTPSKKFRNFYEKLGVKKWKDKVSDLGGLTGFKKDKISDPRNNEFIGRYIVEANYGIAVHLISIILGFTICVFYLPYALNVLLPVALVNAIINYMSYISLRFNLPKLRTLYKYNERQNLREKNNKTL